MTAAPDTAMRAQAVVGLTLAQAVAMFASFALAYFFSALVRAITATLAPAFSAELGLGAAELGLLAGAYFLGFAAVQLPLGSALDRHGPKRVLLALLVLAVIGCAAFAAARGFAALIAARTLIGMGVGACLMAPMTSFRQRLSASAQMRATSWMLMTGSLGMLASTLPVQWLLPELGWRGLFWVLALLIALVMVAIAGFVPADIAAGRAAAASGGYRDVFRDPTFQRYVPLGFFNYGGMVAVQSLWAGPWLTRVCGYTAQEAALGLFGINSAMLVTFMLWGAVLPRLYRRGVDADRLMTWGVPLSLSVLVFALLSGSGATAWAWSAYCVSSTFVALTQPSIGHRAPAALAGRALSAFNLVVFAGVFVVQWGIGLLIDLLQRMGWQHVPAFQGAFAAFAVCCVLSYLWFLRHRGNPSASQDIGTVHEYR